ncbi:MAG: hypothetical protein ACK4SZ_02070 [Allosphingosinicella sp.]|uniref:hypothetical protein n=1 Tax=Allosphingosinicella sp. TaxID=2823234 RepID=UPI0039484F8C
MTYRQAAGSDTWHWCSNCSLWPENPARTSTSKPTTGELCNQCRSKQDNGTCKS